MGLEPRRGQPRRDVAPKEADFYLGTGEVTYLPEVGRRMVYILLCQGRLLWRSSEKAKREGRF